jgi:hypothetical protein
MPLLDLLIDKGIINNYAQLALNIEDRFLQPHIRAAQNIDIEPLLGNEFYYDMVQNRDNDNYKALLNGGNYTYQNRTYYFDGLRAAIACYAYARYAQNANVVSTPFGMQTKSAQEYATTASNKDVQGVCNEKRNEGLKYLSDCLLFLNRNESTYPLWRNEACGSSNELPQSIRFGRPKKY